MLERACPLQHPPWGMEIFKKKTITNISIFTIKLMRHLSKFMLGAMALGLWSCSSDEPLNGGSNGELEGTKGDFNATLTIQLPTTRSTTQNPEDENGHKPAYSSNGYEIGQIYENNVNDVLVVLASQDATNPNKFAYVTYGHSTAAVLKDETMPTYALQFESKTLGEQYGNELYVFAYCNPSDELVSYFKEYPKTDAENADPTDWIDKVKSIVSTEDGIETENGDIWANNGFLMTNALISSPVTIKGANDESKEDFFKNHNTPAKAFNLGTITVERVAARFDFESTNNNIYTVKDNRNGEDVAQVEFTAMALFNEAKSTYYLTRTSATGFDTGATLCGPETPTNWVVGPYASQFAALGTDYTSTQQAALFPNYLYQLDYINWADKGLPEGMDPSIINGYHSGGYSANLNWTSITNWNATADGDDWTDATGTDYRIWRYATENVIPGTANQKQGVTTGIMFKAELKALTDPQSEQAKVIAQGMAAGRILYALNGVIYGDAASVAVYAKVHPHSDLAKAYKASGLEALNAEAAEKYNRVIVDATGHVTPNGNFQLGKFKDLGESAGGFTLYRPTVENGTNHYYMYYPYFNRHNTLGANDGMTTMEFQVVRNNVYKLKVTSVLNFGYAEPKDDPTPPGDNEDDETPKVLFRVSVKVLPWVVRVNNIEF